MENFLKLGAETEELNRSVAAPFESKLRVLNEAKSPIKQLFKLNGFFNTNGLERYLRKYVLDENDFSRLGVELYIVATQQSSPEIFFKSSKGNFLEQLR